MNPTDAEIICGLCGAHFGEEEGRVCHVACPLHRSCQLLSCPRCGYEMPAPTRLTRWLSKWMGEKEETSE